MCSNICVSGKRVRNTLAIYPAVQNNPAKAGLILDVIIVRKDDEERRKPLWEGPMVHQVVGRVMAYQAYDG